MIWKTVVLRHWPGNRSPSHREPVRADHVSKINKFSCLLHAGFIGLCEYRRRVATRSVSLTSKRRRKLTTSKAKLLLTWMATAATAGFQVTLLADEPKNEPLYSGSLQWLGCSFAILVRSLKAKFQFQIATLRANP